MKAERTDPRHIKANWCVSVGNVVAKFELIKFKILKKISVWAVVAAEAASAHIISERPESVGDTKT